MTSQRRRPSTVRYPAAAGGAIRAADGRCEWDLTARQGRSTDSSRPRAARQLHRPAARQQGWVGLASRGCRSHRAAGVGCGHRPRTERSQAGFFGARGWRPQRFSADDGGPRAAGQITGIASNVWCPRAPEKSVPSVSRSISSVRFDSVYLACLRGVSETPLWVIIGKLSCFYWSPNNHIEGENMYRFSVFGNCPESSASIR